MSDNTRQPLRVLRRGALLGATLLAGTALTWGAAWVGLKTVLRTTHRHPRLLTAKLRVRAARDATVQYMMENWNNCPRGIDELVSQQYLDHNNVKDPWGKDLSFRCPAASNDSPDADIWSAGPDGQEGTADDIKSWDL